MPTELSNYWHHLRVRERLPALKTTEFQTCQQRRDDESNYKKENQIEEKKKEYTKNKAWIKALKKCFYPFRRIMKLVRAMKCFRVSNEVDAVSVLL